MSLGLPIGLLIDKSFDQVVDTIHSGAAIVHDLLGNVWYSIDFYVPDGNDPETGAVVWGPFDTRQKAKRELALGWELDTYGTVGISAWLILP